MFSRILRALTGVCLCAMLGLGPLSPAVAVAQERETRPGNAQDAGDDVRLIQMPEGGVPVDVSRGGIVCGPIAPGWALEADNRSIKPPRGLPPGVSRLFVTRLARTQSRCPDSRTTVTVNATARWPVLDPAGTHLYLGEGRLDLSGESLEGVQIVWTRPGVAGESARGVEVCLSPARADKESKTETCTIPLPRDLPADATLAWFPAHADTGDDVVTFDAAGNLVARERRLLRPARIVLPGRITGADGVDISRGPGVVPLLFSQLVAAVDCGQARCELGDKVVLVRSVPQVASAVTMRLRFVPRVFARDNKGGLVDNVTVNLPLLSCPLDVVSGPPLRDVSAPRLVARMDPACAGEAGQLAWAISGEPAEVERVVRRKDGVFVLLLGERITRDRVTLTAARPGIDAAVIGSATVATEPASLPRASLELPGHGKITFIPTNRPAVVTVADPGKEGKFTLVPVEGAYTVASDEGVTSVTGDENAGGFASLRFAFRMGSLPPELASANLAVLTEPVQRAIREASVPAPFSTSAAGAEPLVEFLCGDGKDGTRRIVAGVPARIPFVARDTCRVAIHRERLRPKDGLQEVVLEVNVTGAGGTPRSGTRIEERMILRPGAEPKIFFVKGAIEEFDQIVVRISHIIDEERYVISPTLRTGLPSLQWSVVVEGGNFRLYATAAIPAGLFRVNEPSGELRLNFGVLSRLTLLDDLGKESLLGLEMGVVGLGLVSTRATLAFPTTLAVVTGIGFRFPLGQGAAVGVHVWAAYEFRDEVCTNGVDPGPGCNEASHFSFIFGPSISIGNVGRNL